MSKIHCCLACGEPLEDLGYDFCTDCETALSAQLENESGPHEDEYSYFDDNYDYPSSDDGPEE